MNVTVEDFIIGEHCEQLLESFDVTLTKHSWKEIAPPQQSYLPYALENRLIDLPVVAYN